MQTLKDIAIVVGSTGAMGQVITQRLHDAGLQVVAVARSADALHALAQKVPGIRACPADTERLRRVATARGARDGLSTDQVLDQMRGESAIGAFTTVEQIAWAIALLLAPEADALAGSTLFMDAGRRKGLP